MPSKELEAVLELMRSRPVQPDLSLEEQRAAFEAAPRFPLAEDVKYEEVDAGGVPGEWITTPGAADERVIFYLHGGGYVLGSINTHRELISRLSRSAGARVLAIDYRLAPENPFPAAVHDSVSAYRWLLSQGVEPGHIVVGGDSAGGGLTVATLLAIRDAEGPLPAAGVCISPWVDMECTSVIKHATTGGMIQPEHILGMAKAYLGGVDARTPLASPIFADLKGLPPLLIQVGGAEELLDDSTRLAERAEAVGVDVTLESWEDMFHVWHSYAGMLPEGQQAIDRIGEFVREKMG
ncbi:MAG: alpha/beta hydrolase [Dehalococcoidia bacterium]|nr:alpha/beta hydrolase [Dehalococcoidia bacterium]